MSFAKKIQKELGNYAKLKDFRLGKWQNKGIDRPHILYNDCYRKNLIGKYGEDFWKDEKLSKIKLHQYFHHLNSSQAMCINFFFPLIRERKLDIILKELKLDNEEVNYDSVKFEKESEIDDKKQICEKISELNQDQTIPTSFDFYFETQSGIEFYFEIKYTESKFGGAKKDKDAKSYAKKYKLKYEKIYKEVASGKIISNNEADFLNQYQIMRNLIHVSDNSYIVFVIPEENKRVYIQAIGAQKLVMEQYQNKVNVLTWENLYDIIEKQNFTNSLKKHFDEFKKKYKLKL
jgi:hypothetical protein